MTILKLLASEQFWTISKPLAKVIADYSDKYKKAGLPILAATLYAEIASAMVSHKSNCIFRTVEKIEQQTYLTDHVQRKCRKALQDVGVLKVVRKGVPAKLYYLIDQECENTLLELLHIQNKLSIPLRTGYQSYSEQDLNSIQNINKNTNNKNNKNNKHIVDADASTLFNLFWDKFNNKVNKQAAIKAWAKLSKADQQKAIDSIELYDQYLALTEYKKCHPSTYLNQKRFEDDFKALISQERAKSGKNTPSVDLVAIRKELTALYTKHKDQWKDRYNKLAQKDLARAMEVVREENPNWF